MYRWVCKNNELVFRLGSGLDLLFK